MWTKFWDMHSGGSQKEKWDKIYIEAPEDEAALIFYNRFGHNPHRVTCTCCGSDYSIDSHESLAQLTGFQRNCAYDKNKYIEKQATKFFGGDYMTLDEYIALPTVLIIHADEIQDSE